MTIASEALDRIVDFVVDYQVVVLGIGARFLARALEPARDRGLGFGAALAQPLLEFVEARRQHENRAPRHAGYLPRIWRGALDIDIEQDVAAGLDGAVERSAQGAVAGVEDLRPFGQFTAVAPAYEFSSLTK